MKEKKRSQRARHSVLEESHTKSLTDVEEPIYRKVTIARQPIGYF